MEGVGEPGLVDDHERFFHSRDPRLRAELLVRYEPLAGAVAARFSRNADDHEILRQVAFIGILLAIDRFDPRRGVRFTTFAWSTASGEIKRHRRGNGWCLHLPRGVQECYIDVAAGADDLPAQLGHEVTVDELVERTGHAAPLVRECLALRAAHPRSIDLLHDDGPELTCAGRTDPQAEQIEDRDALVRALRLVPPAEREVLLLYFVDGLTQREIADRLGGSQMTVSRALGRALNRMRGLLGAHGAPAAG